MLKYPQINLLGNSKMKKIIDTRICLSLIALTIFLPLQALASNGEFYGKVNVSLVETEINSDKNTDTRNNASRIGYKSKYALSDDLNLIIQIENEFDAADGRADGDKVFKQRNTFIGISGSFGKLFVGTHDTAFKKAQLKVDLFNDTNADIKNILVGENRMQDMVGYESPEIYKGLKFTLNNIKTSSESYQSYSIDYKRGDVSSSFAVDSGLKGFESRRFALVYPLNKSTFGILVQDSENTNTLNSENGYVYSFKHKLTSKGTLMVQSAKSDMKVIKGEQNTIGYGIKTGKNSKIFAAYSKLKKDQKSKNKTMLSVGFEIKF